MQINRLFEIVYILLEKKTVTARELSQHFELSTRTIYRYIELLSGAGIPIFMSKGKGGGISILPGYVLNKTYLTENEKIDILSSLRAVTAVNKELANDAFQKLNCLFGEAAADWIEVDFSTWGGAEKEKETFNILKESILRQNTINFTYNNGNGELSHRCVEPLKLVFKGQSWYLFGHCLKRKDNRFFKLTRMSDILVTDICFTRAIPKKVIPDEQKLFDVEFVNLLLKFSPSVGFRIRDEFQDYEVVKDNYLIVRVKYPRNKWLYSYILSFGTDCEVLEPIEIRNNIRKMAKKIYESYT